MLQSLLSGGDLRTVLTSLLLRLPIVLLDLTVHEYAHGYAALKLGDPTARNLGRLTLNPIKHLNPFGFLCMLLVGFGWANPVPINPRYFKDPRRGMALSAIAGPLSNLGLGFFFALLEKTTLALITHRILPLTEGSYTFVMLLLTFLSLGAFLNVCLAVFNLLPIPPFDGSRFVYMFLPPKAYFGIMRYEKQIMLAVMLLLLLGVLDIPLELGTRGVLSGMYWLLERIPFFR